MGYIYLLLEVDKDGGERHKIGFTKNDPEKRKNQLKTGNSNVISVLKFYKTNNYKHVEKWLHRKFANCKTEADNEWFSLSNDQVISFIDECDKIDKMVSLLLKENPFYN